MVRHTYLDVKLEVDHYVSVEGSGRDMVSAKYLIEEKDFGRGIRCNSEVSQPEE